MTLNITVKEYKRRPFQKRSNNDIHTKRNQFCILISGNADLVRYDLNGNRTIVEHLSKNDIFGEVFYTVTTNNELLVEAREKCEVLIYIYDSIHTKM